jgi:hypothetical protein
MLTATSSTATKWRGWIKKWVQLWQVFLVDFSDVVAPDLASVRDKSNNPGAHSSESFSYIYTNTYCKMSSGLIPVFGT